MAFSEMTVAQLLDALASPDPTPGGGTAAAVAGAMGTSLLVMVTGLAKSKTNTDDEKAALAGARRRSSRSVSALTALRRCGCRGVRPGDERLSPAQGDRRRKGGAVSGDSGRRCKARRRCRCRRCARARPRWRTPEPWRRAATARQLSDVGVAIGLLEAAAAGAEANVRINLGSVRDAEFTSTAAEETGRLLAGLAGRSLRRGDLV